MKPSPPVVLYPGREQRPDFALRVGASAVWLTRPGIADPFGTSTANINSHIRTILKERELLDGSAIKESLTTAADGRKDRTNVERMLVFNERPVLQGAGRVSHDRMKEIVSQRYEEFDGRRREAERLAADAEDLRALEEATKSLEAQQKAAGTNGGSVKIGNNRLEHEHAIVRAKWQAYLKESGI